MISRIKAAVLASIILSGLLFTLNSCSRHEDSPRAKYVFLFIGDGMGVTHIAATESYLSYKEGKLGGEQLVFTGFPILGMATTHSANREITCSAASGTAISTGYKTNNSRLCVDPSGKRLESITYKLRKEGYKIGIMSTVPVNHATPACFYGHNEERDDYYSIAKEIPGSGFEFFAGHGFLQYFGKDGKEQAITEFLEENGVTVCFGTDEYNAKKSNASQIALCQPSSRNTNASDYIIIDENEGTDMELEEMLASCLDFLGDEKPFFIMCEGGEIDWDAHANMTMPMIDDILELDDAVEVAYEFYRKHPEETLIIVTADHETGGIALGGPTGGSRRGSHINWDVYESDEADKAASDIDANKALNDNANIGWTTSGHTGAPVPVYAIGNGAERFAGRMDNTDISKRIILATE